MIKPDGVQRNLIAPILERFLAKVRESAEPRPALRAVPSTELGPHGRVASLHVLWMILLQGYILRGLKFLTVSKSLAETHYADLSSKPFFGGAQPGLPHFDRSPAIDSHTCAPPPPPPPPPPAAPRSAG